MKLKEVIRAGQRIKNNEEYDGSDGKLGSIRELVCGNCSYFELFASVSGEFEI